MKLFREHLLARLVERHAISQDLARKLVAWTHPGFSSHIGEAIPLENRKTIEDLACYLVREPFSLRKLVYHKAVLYRSRLNPSLGRNSEAMDPLEWLARLADHIPDPGRHRTHFYAHYANRVRGERPGEGEPCHAGEAEPPPMRRCSSTWARLLAKVFQADPLVCRRCGGPLKLVAYVTDALAIRQILEHLDLSPLEKPPPEIADCRPRAGRRRGARDRDAAGLSCREPLPASPHRGRGVCAGQSRRDILHPKRPRGDARAAADSLESRAERLEPAQTPGQAAPAPRRPPIQRSIGLWKFAA